MSSQVFRRDNYRNPNGVRADSARTPGRGMGKGMGREKKKLGMTTIGWELALPWAERELPDEIPAFAASAAMVYGSSHGGAFPTPDWVRRRLEFQGRDKATFERPRGAEAS